MTVQPTRIYGVFPYFVSCWFGWSTKLLGLQMKTATNEQLSLRLSLPKEKTTMYSNLLVWRQVAQLNCKNKTLFFWSVNLSFHFPLCFHFPSGTWNFGDLLYLPQHLPFLPRSWSHNDSVIACFFLPEIFLQLTLAPLRGISPFPWLAGHSFCSSTPNWYRNLSRVQSLSFYSGQWRRRKVSGEQSSSR